MIINGKVYCMFEQSGTFKNEFKKLGYVAEDYDIQDNFGETDHVIDLFAEIDNAYDNKPSIFDSITQDDLIMAFFPCIYFCAGSQMCFYLSCPNYKNLSKKETIKQILERAEQRKIYYSTLIKFCAVCMERKFRMIFENPWSEQTYLKANFIKVPDLVDYNRMSRGDFFVKPTAYWYWNCKPTYGESYQNDKEKKTHDTTRSSKVSGICSEERSMISPDYARNFICDFIIGKQQNFGQLTLL